MSIENAKENCRTMIKILTGKPNVIFTNRCNTSIKKSLHIALSINRSNVLIQDEGGWLYYDKFIKQNGLDSIRMITNHGLIFPKELLYYDNATVLLINSLSGYIAQQPMNEISTNCLVKDILLINDVSGSIGTPDAKYGDIIVGSFGKGKPVDAGFGGFIATEDASLLTFIEDKEDFQMDYYLLETKLKNLTNRLSFLKSTASKVKDDLKDFDIIHKEKDGLNVIVKFSSEEEKEKIIFYCKENNFEHTLCPREIRIMEDAVSIEIKRLEQSE